MSSSVDSSLPPLKPDYIPKDASAERHESAKVAKLISSLHLIPHIEGGYFVETDRDPLKVPNPFLQQKHGSSQAQEQETRPAGQTTFYTTTGSVSANLDDKLTSADKAAKSASSSATAGQDTEKQEDATRNASTTIHYFLSPESPLGAFHRNKGRTIHTLHRGRGRYVIIHADEVMPSYDTHAGVAKKARIETFVVGQDTENGERLQWIVEGGKYKASYLLLDEGGNDGKEENEGLLISETVVPGFEYGDHDFMRMERLEALVTPEQAEEMRWMVRKA